MTQKKIKREICICAAIKTDDGLIIRGHRHTDCFRNLKGRPKYNKPGNYGIEQGFITSFNRFVSRTEGRKLQDAAGILSADKDGYRPDTLYSEDLY